MPRLPHIDTLPKPALFLDFDGTLVDIVQRPDLTSIDPSLLALVGRLHERLDGALAIVSGRPIPDLDRLLQPLVLPAAGIHGVQLREDGKEIEIQCPEPIPDEVPQRLSQISLPRIRGCCSRTSATASRCITDRHRHSRTSCEPDSRHWPRH